MCQVIKVVLLWHKQSASFGTLWMTITHVRPAITLARSRSWPTVKPASPVSEKPVTQEPSRSGSSLSSSFQKCKLMVAQSSA